MTVTIDVQIEVPKRSALVELILKAVLLRPLCDIQRGAIPVMTKMEESFE